MVSFLFFICFFKWCIDSGTIHGFNIYITTKTDIGKGANRIAVGPLLLEGGNNGYSN